MSKLRRVAPREKSAGSINNIYKRFNFTRNPFPSSPGVTIGADDPRENGSIYNAELVKAEEEQFEELLIPKPGKPEKSRIAFLMDWATNVGRGIGKTAFLNHQNNRIMKDFGEELTQGDEVIFSSYIAPIVGDSYNHFWRLSRLFVQKFIHQDIISATVCRLRAFSGKIPEDILNTVEDELQDTVGNDDWLKERGVDVGTLNHQVRTDLEKLNINQGLSESLAFWGYRNSLFSKYFNSLSDVFWRKEGAHFLFNDLVKVFIHAGFSKGILLFDELEHVFPALNRRDRRIFTDAIRYYFIDGDNENSRKSFFQLLLVVHPYLQELMIPHWDATGMERFAALAGKAAQNYTIYFKPIAEEFAVPLAQEYINTSRIDSEKTHPLFPFNEEVLLEALKRMGKVPGLYLQFLHSLINEAAEKDWHDIDVAKVIKFADSKKTIEPEAGDSGIPPLEAAKVRLKK